MRRPHPFAWLLAAALVLAIVAAALAPDRAPAVALYWNPIYRAEVALVVLALAYLLGTAGRMAYNGEAFRRIELPGGAALERDAAELDSAATDFDGFSESIIARLEALEATAEAINDRIDQLEGGAQDAGAGVP
jgi:methyl-accepting chemotaxis protein